MKKLRLRSWKLRLTAAGIRCADHVTPSIRKSWHYFANKRRPLGRYSSLADYKPRYLLFFFTFSLEAAHVKFLR
jgi:hypothetical protein